MPRTQSYHLHLPGLSFDHGREMNLLYVVRTLREMSNTLVLFYIPLFLFQESGVILDGLSMSRLLKGVLVISLFYLTVRVSQFLSGIFVGKILSKIGIERGFVIANLIYLVSLCLFFLATTHPLMIFLAAISEGIQISFFWPSYHTIMSKNAHKSRIGQDLGLVKFLITLVTMIAPAAGGVIVVTFGYQSLFLAGAVVVLLGMITSLMMKSCTDVDEISWKEFFSWIKEKTYRRLAVSFAGRYANDAAKTLWPLYVFILLGSADRVGYLYTFSLFLAMLVSYFVGFLVDKHHKNNKPFVMSGWVLSALWFFRTQIYSIWTIAVVDMLDKLVGNFHSLFFDRAWMLRGTGKEALSYFVYREMILSLAAWFFWLVFLLFFVLFDNGWVALFLFAAVGVLFSLFIKDHRG
ncbi:MAG: MFS transporter [Patescibacteria group bacterium]